MGCVETRKTEEKKKRGQWWWLGVKKKKPLVNFTFIFSKLFKKNKKKRRKGKKGRKGKQIQRSQREHRKKKKQLYVCLLLIRFCESRDCKYTHEIRLYRHELVV